MKAWFPKIILGAAFIALAATALYLANTGKYTINNENLWNTGKIFVVISVLALIFLESLHFSYIWSQEFPA